MGFTFLKKLPTPAEIRNQYPIDAAIQEQKEIRRSVMSLQANQINFLQSLVHVLPIMKMLYVIIFFVCVKCRIKSQTKF